jgi:hypothetical protein
MRHITAGLLSAAVVAALTACGITRPPAPRQPPPIVVPLRWPPDALAALPIAIADAHGWFRHAGYRVVNTMGGAVLVAGGTWPASAVFLQRPDLVLVSPVPEPAFRWRDLKSLPLPVTGLSPGEESLVAAVLHEHGVTRVLWEGLRELDARRLFQRHHLPWLLLPALAAARWFGDGAHPVAWLGAASGPVPAWVVVHGQLPVAVLAVLNRALAAIRTTSAATLAREAAPFYPGVNQATLTTVIADAQGLDLFPLTTYLSPGLYADGQTLLAEAGVSWPPYASAVQWQTARNALEVWP